MDTDPYLDMIRKRHPKPYFAFPQMPPADELSFEPLTIENSVQLYRMFAGDPSSFVDRRFKTKEAAEAYARWVLEYGPYLPKHGGCDWLFKYRNHYAGILHLYDMSLETWAQNNKRAWVGFATASDFRRKGITGKVFRHFTEVLFRFYTELEFLHAMTLPTNEASVNFLLKTGFQRDEAERISKDHCFFVRTRSQEC